MHLAIRLYLLNRLFDLENWGCRDRSIPLAQYRLRLYSRPVFNPLLALRDTPCRLLSAPQKIQRPSTVLRFPHPAAPKVTISLNRKELLLSSRLLLRLGLLRLRIRDRIQFSRLEAVRSTHFLIPNFPKTKIRAVLELPISARLFWRPETANRQNGARSPQQTQNT